jgi:hypothetical protein
MKQMAAIGRNHGHQQKARTNTYTVLAILDRENVDAL